jgi:hypothetical protein
MEKIKTCKNCAYREGSGTYARCSKFGLYCSTAKFSNLRCGSDSKGWEQRLDPLLIRLLRLFKELFKI